jgi:hypothetical protein
MTKRCCILLSVLLFSLAAEAQEFTIRAVETTSDHRIIIHYDLMDSTRNRLYTVFVYSSLDNFLRPLTKLSGDAGLEVKPGAGKKIAWRLKEELPAGFDGDVELEVRGRVYIPFIRFEGFQDVEIRKRKTPFTVKWSGGSRQNILNFQLYQRREDQEVLVHTYPNIPNSSEYTLEIPNSVKPGNNYYFRISDTKNTDQVVITPLFAVKRKIPLLMKGVAVAGLGTLAFILLRDDSTDEKTVATPPGPPE